MHKKVSVILYDTTVIFLYVHNLSTHKKGKRGYKSTYTPSYPHYPQTRTGFLVENIWNRNENVFC